MPITRTAKRALRKAERKRKANLVYKNKLAEAKKALRKRIQAGEKEGLEKALLDFYSVVDKTAKVKVISKKTANRYKSVLTKSVNKLLGRAVSFKSTKGNSLPSNKKSKKYPKKDNKDHK
jgi:small subunit ribosomal protein S20